MAVTGNPYGFYPDRTKYPLANLDGQLVPAPHQHVLADITDYGGDTPDIPTGSAWENKDISGTPTTKILTLKDGTYKIPVEAGTTYLFQVNSGYEGKIFYDDGNGTYVDQLPDGWPALYPVFWTCPEDGYVRFSVRKAGGAGDISTSDLDQVGLIFTPNSLSELEKIIMAETEYEEFHYGTNVTIDGDTYGVRLDAARRGHNVSLVMSLMSAVLGTADHMQRYPASEWKELTNDAATRDRSMDPYGAWSNSDFKSGVASGLPARFWPAIGAGDAYVNSDANYPANTAYARRKLWLNFFTTENAVYDEHAQVWLQPGDAFLWGYSEAAENQCIGCRCTLAAVCRGR